MSKCCSITIPDLIPLLFHGNIIVFCACTVEIPCFWTSTMLIPWSTIFTWQSIPLFFHMAKIFGHVTWIYHNIFLKCDGTVYVKILLNHGTVFARDILVTKSCTGYTEAMLTYTMLAKKFLQNNNVCVYVSNEHKRCPLVPF